jgi:hypothetical protein
MKVQLQTASRQSKPSDYWDPALFEDKEFRDSTMSKKRTAFIVQDASIEELIEKADHKSFIVKMEPDLMCDHPEADAALRVYDGYNE